MKARLNYILAKKKLSPTKFASIIGVNPSTISHILAGRNKPGADILRNIVEEFPDVNVNWLLTGQGAWSNNPAEAEETTSEGGTLFDLEEIPEKREGKADEGRGTRVEKEETEKLEGNKEKNGEERGISPVTAAIPPAGKERHVERIILFFDDGTFECYEK